MRVSWVGERSAPSSPREVDTWRALKLAGYVIALVGIAHGTLTVWQAAVPSHPLWVGEVGAAARHVSIVAPGLFAIPRARPSAWVLFLWTIAMCPAQESLWLLH